MKKIEMFERAIEEKVGNLADYGINATLFWAYRNSIESENDLIDFNETIWERDIEVIVRTLKENAVTEFTISSNFSGLIKTLYAFDKLGFQMAGFIEVNTYHKNFETEEHERVPAIRMMKI